MILTVSPNPAIDMTSEVAAPTRRSIAIAGNL